MRGGSMGWWGWVERWRGTLFLVGGVLVVLDATVAAVPVVADTSYPVVRHVFSGGFVLAFIGLLGLYPELADRRPWLARAGAISAGLGTVGFSITIGVTLGQAVGVVAEEMPVWFNSHVLLILIGFVVGYLAFGVASLWTDLHPRSLGFILLVPAILYVILIIGNAVIGISRWIFLLTAGDAAALLAIGYLLRAEDVPAREPGTDESA